MRSAPGRCVVAERGCRPALGRVPANQKPGAVSRPGATFHLSEIRYTRFNSLSSDLYMECASAAQLPHIMAKNVREEHLICVAFATADEPTAEFRRPVRGHRWHRQRHAAERIIDPRMLASAAGPPAGRQAPKENPLVSSADRASSVDVPLTGAIQTF